MGSNERTEANNLAFRNIRESGYLLDRRNRCLQKRTAVAINFSGPDARMNNFDCFFQLGYNLNSL